MTLLITDGGQEVIVIQRRGQETGQSEECEDTMVMDHVNTFRNYSVLFSFLLSGQCYVKLRSYDLPQKNTELRLMIGSL